MPTRTLLLILLTFCVADSAKADQITYNVTVDTSSVFGTAGSLDFNFNPGLLVTQPASLQILNFTSDGTLGDCALNVQGYCPTGDVSGTLPSALTFDNGSPLNDYFDSFTYGNTLSFAVSFFGPALTAPDGVSTSGSTFAFSMFSDAAGTVPTLTTDTVNGFAFTTNVNLDGTTTPATPSAETTVTSTPEPGTVGLMAIGCSLLCAAAVRRRAA
jgi:hypothetical protein